MNKLTKDLEYYAKLPYTIILERYDDQGGYWVARIGAIAFLFDTWQYTGRSIERD